MAKIKVYEEDSRTYFVCFGLTKEQKEKIKSVLEENNELETYQVTGLLPKENEVLAKPNNYKGIPWHTLTEEKIKSPAFIKYLDKNFLTMSDVCKEYMVKEDLNPWVEVVRDASLEEVKLYLENGCNIFKPKLDAWLKQKGKLLTNAGTPEYVNSVKEIINASSEEDIIYVFNVVLKYLT